MKGLFITFEGGEGAGKSTQSKLLYEYLLKFEIPVLLLREPGGTPIGEKIRSIIIDPENSEMLSVTEALLYAAARAQLVSQVIKPALSEGKIVICDRYIDSSFAYQAFGRGLGLDAIEKINSYAIGGLWPDITFYMRLSPEIGFRRKKGTVFDRLEKENSEFHRLVFEGFEKAADIYKERFRPINADASEREIHETIIDIVNQLIKPIK